MGLDIEQLEALAFWDDREAALAELVPGSVEHDYYRCIQLQLNGKLDEVERVLGGWRKRHVQETELYQRLIHRQLLLRAGLDLAGNATRLREETGAVLWHEPAAAAATQRHPTRLDPALVSTEAMVSRALQSVHDLSYLTDFGLHELGGRPLSASSIRHLVQRLNRCGFPGIVQIVSDDLGEQGVSHFGTRAAHRLLTLGDLESLAVVRPELRQNRNWVDFVLARLAPADHIDLEHDPVARRGHVARLWAFVEGLPASFNGLKAHVLWHRLDLDRRRGVFDRALFLGYLALPRARPHGSESWLKRFAPEEHVALGAGYASTSLLTVQDDSELVLGYLRHFLASEDSSAFAAFFERAWLDQVLASTRLLQGDPAQDRWVEILGSAQVAALREQVEIELSLTNPTHLGRDQPVALDVRLKNVPALLVKVFRINTIAYFTARKSAQLDSDIDLDGLVAHDELTFTFDAPPMRSTLQRIELPQCARPGTYVVELIGNGKSSRALLEKGRLLHTTRVSVAGVVLEVFDEQGTQLPDAQVWMDGHAYTARADGSIVLPFSTRPGQVPVLLVHGDLAVREVIDLPAEQYGFWLGLHVEREALVAGKRAKLLLRPMLSVAGWPASLALVEEPVVEITSTDILGTPSQRTEPIELRDDAETELELQVPEDLVELSIRVRGRVRVLSTQSTVQLEDGVSFAVNGIQRSQQTEAVHLSKVASGHVLHLLGKTGEARPGRPLNVSFLHRASTWELLTTLETDEQGRIELGPLEGVQRVTANWSAGSRSFSLGLEDVAAPAQLHLLEGASVAIPAPAQLGMDIAARGPDRLSAWLSLVELRSGAPAYDRTRQVRYERSALTIAGLTAGSYTLQARGLSSSISIVVLPAARALGQSWARRTASSVVELSPAMPLLREVAAEADAIVVRVDQPSPLTRVHVIATKLRAERAVERSLEHGQLPLRQVYARPAACVYLSGRDIGDEVRYVLERRKAKRRPGIMLERPALLLNPWAVRSTTSVVQQAKGGDAFGAARARHAGAGPAYAAAAHAGPELDADASLDFLRKPASVLANLRVDAAGELRIPRSDLDDASHVQVLVVDPVYSSSGELTLPETPLAPRDRSLRTPLPMQGHFTQDKRVQALLAGERLVFEDRRSVRLHLIDSVARAHQLLSIVCGQTELQTFSFVHRWQALDERERGQLYSKHACHELHLFLYFKDRPYFERVVRPYLSNKRDKTFVDAFLLEQDLEPWTHSWRFARLNTFERILLGLRMPALRASIARSISDAVDLLPRDAERDARLVDTLLGGSALDPGGGGLPPAEADMELLAEAEEVAPDIGEARLQRSEVSKKAKGRGRSDAPATRATAAMPPAPPPAAAPAPALAFGAPSPQPARGGGGDDRFAGAAKDLASRLEQQQLYRGADKTEELAETDWWRTRRASSDAGLIPPNRFWRDLARHDPAQPFLSPYLGECSTSFAEAMCALAVLEVPFVAGAHSFQLGQDSDESLAVTAASHALAARSCIVQASLAPSADGSAQASADVLVAQSLLRMDDRWEWDGAEQREKYVTTELSTGVVYACRVVVTNTSSAMQKLDLLVQIPERAMVVDSGIATRTHHLRLPPYSTSSFEYAFYFPRSGTFSHFPPHVTRQGVLLASVEPKPLEVTARPVVSDTSSFQHLSQHGSLEEVLAFLERSNLGRVDLTSIAWRMRDRTAFERTLALLEARHVYCDTLWAYALLHCDAPRVAQWLRHQPLLGRVGPALEGGIAATDALEQLRFEHLEYAPLINARAHQLGARRKILNGALEQHYRALLMLCAHQSKPSADARLAAAQIWFSLDRTEEASAMLARVMSETEAPTSAQLQLAYLRAYDACAAGQLARARELAGPHANHPVDRWRHRFAALLAMVDEAEGGAVADAVDEHSRDQRMGELASKQPSLSLRVEHGSALLAHDNLSGCELRFYSMDLELLFSREPFGQGDVERFSWIQPLQTLRVDLSGPSPTRVAMPEALTRANLVVEAVADGARCSVAHYANDLDVRLYRRFGQLRVVKASTGAALPAVYVKVYARFFDGGVRFYKDGYTDVRGRFDYATLSTDDLDRVTSFALLVFSDTDGAAVLEAEPPVR